MQTTENTTVEAPEELGVIKLSAKEEDDLLEEARERFTRAETTSSDNRKRFAEDIQFLAGDQWDERLKKKRESAMRPCLVMDRIGTHVNQVVNAQRQNKPAIKVHPIGNGSDVKVAEVFDGLIRHIEATSNAPMIYETAGWTQVAGGYGYWRVLTKFNDETSFEQDLILARITNPNAVYMDPMAREQDGSDAHWCFVVDEMDRKDFDRRYPGADSAGWGAGDAGAGWWSEETVRVADYYRVRHQKETLYLLEDGTSQFETEYNDAGSTTPILKRRAGYRRIVEYFKLGGDAVLDSRTWPSRWIPIVRVVGNEVDLDGKLEYSGIVKRAKDAQRAYNFWVSSATETAQGNKAPYIGAKGQFKGVESQWKSAASGGNPSYLEYEPVTIDGTMAPPPERQPPPSVPTAVVEMVRMMADDMHWITGQQEANFGAPSNEQSGRAIIARAQQGDNATYHYVDNLSRAIRHTGRILVDMAPRVIDTARILRIVGEDGTSSFAEHDPDQTAPYEDVQQEDGRLARVFNLGVGRYDVETSVGPNFTTRRLESVDAMQALLQADGELWKIIGDIYFRRQDWPGAQEIADRMAKLVDPALKTDPNDPEKARQQQMEQALAGANKQLEELTAFREHAIAQADAADKQVKDLQRQLDDRSIDLEAKTISARASADASIHSDNVKLEIARIGAIKEEAVAAIASLGDQIDEVQRVVAAVAKFTGAVVSDEPMAPTVQ